MTTLNDDQARLLEAYCDALARDPGATPPDDLDPEFAAVARHLAARTAPEPEASTLAAIRARLFAPQTPVTTHEGWQPETWTASPMAMRMPPASPAAPRMRESTSPPVPRALRAAPPQAAASLPPAATAPPAARPAYPAPAPASPPYGSAPPPASPPPAAYAAPAVPPARRPSFPTRLAGALVGTLIAAVALGVLLVSLVINRPPNGVGNAPSTTVAGPAVICGTAPTPTPQLPPTRSAVDAGRTATVAVQITATAVGQPTATPVAPGPRVDPCTTPGTGLLTLDQAAAIIRALLHDPAAELYARYSVAYGTEAPIVVVERLFPVDQRLLADRDRFEIDASTGELLGASWVSNESATIADQPIDEAEAITRAEALARSLNPSFERLERRRVRSSPGTTFPNTEVVWRLRAEDSGAWLPTAITVRISLRTGLPISYSWWRPDYTGPTKPLITEADAQERVLAVARQDPRYANLTVTESTLWVAAPKELNNEQTDFRLVWTITIANPPQGALGERIILTWHVDAITGEVFPNSGRG